MTETPRREVLTYLIECAERDIKLGEQMGVSDGALRIAKLTYYGLCELGRLQAQRCETCGLRDLPAPWACPVREGWIRAMSSGHPEALRFRADKLGCTLWEPREEPQPCP